jgi:hypothetical protein
MSVYANSRLILHKGDGQQHVAAPPDVCKTPSPGGPVPIPYVNIAMDSDLAKGAKKTTIEGKAVAIANSELSTSTGDEPGTAGGGLVSSKTKGKLTWASASPDVMVEGKGVVRFLDPTQHNGNTSNTAFISAGTTALAYGDDSPCTICEKSLDNHRIHEGTATKSKAKGFLEALGEVLKAQRPDIQRAMAIKGEINATESRYKADLDAAKQDATQAKLAEKRIEEDIKRNPQVNAPLLAADHAKARVEVKKCDAKVKAIRGELKAKTDALVAERKAINARLKGSHLLGMDDKTATHTKGYMVGILVCECGLEYVACSGTETPGFKDAVRDAKAIACPMHDSGAVTNGAGKLPEASQAKYNDLVAATVKGESKWECAAPKCIQKCNGDGHKPMVLTEMYFSPISDDSVEVKYSETKPDATGTLVTQMVTKDFGSGASVPSCDRCQVLLPGMTCDTKDAECP